MVSQVDNFFLINSPAGSGKTTQIKTMIRQFITNKPNDNILCITYTNRAAEEIAKDITTQNVYIGTIHSFLSNFMNIYFSHEEVIRLYFFVYGEKIKERIENCNGDEHVEESNNKYREKYGDISYDIIKKNIKKLSYNESPFNSLYYGGLSHDDLITFSKYIIDTYPVIRKRLHSKYQIIFIDEYQDTTASVLDLFYESVEGSKTKLYLFGDKMQQIYKNYDGSFEKRFSLFNTDFSLCINYRSIPLIVDILNKIYNDSKMIQNYSNEMRAVNPDFVPRVIFCNNVDTELVNIQKAYPETLVLYLFNKERFDAIGSGELYQELSHAEKYAYNRAYSAVDVLTTDYSENPDPLIKLLYIVSEFFTDFQDGKYGLIIQKIKNNLSIFNKIEYNIKTHMDKSRMHKNLETIFSVFSDDNKNIGELLNALYETNIILPEYYEGIVSDKDYLSVLNISTSEIRAMINYLLNPKVSTQHGVKGESHDSVVFVAEDSNNNPVVRMYKFFDVWSNYDLSIDSFQQLYYSYADEIISLQKTIGIKVNDITKEIYSSVENQLLNKANTIYQRFKDDPIFNYLCGSSYKDFLDKPGVTRAKNCFKDSLIYGVLSAYKLFYVGCSRARKNLTILVDKSKVMGDLNLLEKKFRDIGFIIKQTT